MRGGLKVEGPGRAPYSRGHSRRNCGALAGMFVPTCGDQAERDELSEIVEGKLFLTNHRGVEDKEGLRRAGVTHIVCVNEQENVHPGEFSYYNIDTLEDQEDHDASPHFESVRRFTEGALAQGGAVCFHCAAGISRSTTLVLAYLVRAHGMPLREAFALVHSRRKVAWPNRSFMRQLIAYEHSVHGRSTLDLDEWDSWTSGDLAARAQQHDVSVSDRVSSLKGKQSARAEAYAQATATRDSLL